MNSISSIRSIPHGKSGSRIEADVQIGTKSHNIYFQCKTEKLSPSPNALIAASILPAMRSGGTLSVSAAGISSQLTDSLSSIQDIYCSWESKLNRVQLTPAHAPTPPEKTSSNRIGTFFSGGVDSFYTALKHQKKITDLVFVHGFDIKLSDTGLRAKTSEQLRSVAQNSG